MKNNVIFFIKNVKRIFSFLYKTRGVYLLKGIIMKEDAGGLCTSLPFDIAADFSGYSLSLALAEHLEENKEHLHIRPQTPSIKKFIYLYKLIHEIQLQKLQKINKIKLINSLGQFLVKKKSQNQRIYNL